MDHSVAALCDMDWTTECQRPPLRQCRTVVVALRASLGEIQPSRTRQLLATTSRCLSSAGWRHPAAPLIPFPTFGEARLPVPSFLLFALQ
jgi:hypothetical protein